MEQLENCRLEVTSDFITDDPTKCVKVYGKSSSEKLLTVPDLFAKSVRNYPDRVAMKYQNEVTKKWMSITYREYKSRVDQIAKAFLKLGLENKGRVAVLAFNCVQWNVSQMAAIHAGGQIVGIYNTNSADACFYILDKCDANIVVVDDDIQLAKIQKIRSKLPHLKTVVQILPSDKNHDDVLKWSDLEAMDTSDFDQIYEKNLKAITANSCCCLIFTSGTTGFPKGAMISHDNVIFSVKNVISVFRLSPKQIEVFVSYLPLSHLAGSAVDIFLVMTIAATIYFADRNALKGTLINTLLEARPTTFFAVPRIYEKFYEKISHEIGNTQGFKKSIALWAQKSALKFHQNRLNRNLKRSISYTASKNLILSKIKSKVGLERVKSFIAGSAPFKKDVFNFFLSLDMPITDLYGLTEGGITIAMHVDEMMVGSVGKMASKVESKIIDPDSKGYGELCMRGRNIFMGYIGDMEKTREAIDDDLWLHTGDIGCIDNEGYVFLTGRIKELLITAGGENIPFLNIENAIKAECSAISNAFLIGDARKFLSVLITLKTKMNENGAPCDEFEAETIQELQNLGLKCKLLSEVLKSGPDEKVLKLIQEAINRANEKAMSNAQKVQKFVILPNDFSLATGELGPTLKLKRSFVVDKYKKEIEQFYK